MTAKILFRGLIWITSLVAIGYALKVSGLGSSIDKAWVDSDIRGQGFTGELLFVGVGMMFTAVGLPRQVICFLAGYAFGLLEGTALAMVATVLGCIVAFFYARVMGRSFVVGRFPDRVQRIDDFLHENPLSMTLLIRLLPLGSNVVTNLAAGVSGVGAVPFFLGSAIGYLPQTLVFALVGSGFSVDPELRIAISIILFAVSGFLGVFLFRKYRRGKSFDIRVERELGVEDSQP
ncbi:MAG: TVP38/TMEM64 family protein [Rhodospirillaceae bacterium]|nr:TVP38/TMEM64 family protein [Rhodospirillaceae bacterium]MBL6940768.1 TVP38/TMEM64 family protein [Rhodospirillales bacterium]